MSHRRNPTYVRISDHREVVAKVQGQEPLYTPAGKRPIDPALIRISYSIDAGTVWRVDVQVNGSPLNEPNHRVITRRITDLDAAPAWIQDAVAYYHPEREAENIEREAAELVEQTTIHRMNMKNSVDLALTTPRKITLAFVNAAREMLGDAPNYTETPVELPSVSLEVGVAGEPERYVLIVQRVGKLTPHQARMQAEAERDELAEQLAALTPADA